MNGTAVADEVHVATMHRADAPAGRTARFHLRTRFDGLPCCQRVWTGTGKQAFLHGYERTFEIEFACAETEPGSGLVVNNECIKTIRAALRFQFDHTTLVAADDPQRDLFELMAINGVIDLRIMDNTGTQCCAAWVFDTAERIVGPATQGRVWVSRIEARQSRNNIVTLTGDR
jgi:6-pyruvoyltetrahydropterin/6-carboxytetrahydropterin synthase